VVFLVGVSAAFCLGLGYVLQQRTAASARQQNLLSWRLLFELMHNRVWWLGIGAMVIGQLLGGLALDLAAVTVVEPLLSANLLFAFAIAAFLSSRRVRWHEVLGALLVSAALAVFIAVGNPHSASHARTHLPLISLVVASVAAAVIVLTVIGKRRGMVANSVLFATAAGICYGLQDASTRAALLQLNRHGMVHVLTRPWIYIVIAAAVAAIMLSQSAFKAARLDLSLPPIAAAEPVTGIALGIALLGDTVSVSDIGLIAETGSLACMIIGVVLIGRSKLLADIWAKTRPGGAAAVASAPDPAPPAELVASPSGDPPLRP
jgi:drug/metabolite transporter (DMT)-like permease